MSALHGAALSAPPSLHSPHRNDGRTKCCKRITQIAIFTLVFTGLLSVLVWDLRKVQSLSQVIHDDHIGSWRAMSNAETSRWWNPLDMCMLNMSSQLDDYRTYKTKKCAKIPNSKTYPKLQLSCNAGASIGGKICQAPYNSRWFYRAQLRNEVLGNASNAVLRDALRRFAQLQKPIVFVGDGISRQNQEALLCEILRTDKVTLRGKTGSIDGNYTINWKEKNQPPLDVHYMKLTAMYDNGAGENDGDNMNAAPHNSYSWLSLQTRRLQATTGNISAAENVTSAVPANATARIPLSLTLDEIKYRVDDLIRTHANGIVLIANVGVFYNSRELFRTELPDLLGWMDALGREKNSTVYFRETAAQHWNHTASGYFDLGYIQNEYDNGTCTPVLDATPEFDWRNTDVRHMIEHGEHTSIHLMPFRDLTLPLYSMHPTPTSSAVNGSVGTQAQDCTHYCYFPQMWQGIWYQLYKDLKQR